MRVCVCKMLEQGCVCVVSVAVTVFLNEPAAISAGVIVYVAVVVTVSPPSTSVKVESLSVTPSISDNLILTLLS